MEQETTPPEIRFDEQGLAPVIVQDAASGEVRMLGYMNALALERTLTTGKLHFWSRSRQKLWMKGETSGHTHDVVEMRADCDGDTLLARVRANGPTCHRDTDTCFDGGTIFGSDARPVSASVIDQVARVVTERRASPVEGSYTSYLLTQGVDKIGKKIGEEAAEVIIAAKNASPDDLANEASDLIYHLLVLLEACQVPVERVWEVLRERRGGSAPGR